VQTLEVNKKKITRRMAEENHEKKTMEGEKKRGN